jgi:hypothetical protein
MKKIQFYLIIFLSSFVFSNSINSAEIDIYKKIDLFGEVLEKINKEYVDEIDQSESMDSAINGLHLIHIQLTCLQKYFRRCKQKLVESLAVLELKLVWRLVL